jgi:K+-transporting ATPase A subunit
LIIAHLRVVKEGVGWEADCWTEVCWYRYKFSICIVTARGVAVIYVFVLVEAQAGKQPNPSKLTVARAARLFTMLFIGIKMILVGARL